MAIFKGSGVAITTPFNEDFSVNHESYKKHIDFLINNDTDAIISCGTTGESSTMNDYDHIETVKKAVEFTNGRIPVIAGAGSNDTKHGIELMQEIDKTGVDGFLLVTPYYNKTTQKGLIKHYEQLASCTKSPIILYNVPGRTSLNIEPETVLELSKIPNIIGIKEASGDLEKSVNIAHLVGDDFDIYTGNDSQIVPMMSIGAKGVITVVGNIMPKETHKLCYDFLEGRIKDSLDIQLKLYPLICALFSEVNPIPIKSALNLMGFNQGSLRAPLFDLEPHHLDILKNEMKKLNLI